MTKEERIKEVNTLLYIIGTSIQEALQEGHTSDETTYYLFATCLEALVTHELMTGENLLKPKAKVIPFHKPKLVPDDNKPVA